MNNKRRSQVKKVVKKLKALDVELQEIFEEEEAAACARSENSENPEDAHYHAEQLGCAGESISDAIITLEEECV